MSAAVLSWKEVARVCLLLAGVLLLLSLAALSLGSASVPVSAVGTAVWEMLTGAETLLTPEQRLILLDVRLPRILLAMVVGAGLGVAGAGFQALLRNPLADPYVLGVSSGAALGAIVSLLAAAPAWKPAAAFIGATLTVAAVYYLGRRGEELSPYTLLLAGVVTASFLSAVITFLFYFLSGPDLRGMAFWLIGDLNNAPPLDRYWWAWAGPALVAIGVIYVFAGDMNILLGGESEAQTLGVNVRRTKLVVYLAASLATGLAVSVSGAIGYLGLLVPHLVRLLFGSDYRLLVPATALGGAVVLVAADTLARTVVAPSELPAGAVTAIVGAPVFIYLLRSRPATPPSSGGGA